VWRIIALETALNLEEGPVRVWGRRLRGIGAFAVTFSRNANFLSLPKANEAHRKEKLLMSLEMFQVCNTSARVGRRGSGRKWSHVRRVEFENLEGRQLLAADMAALTGDLVTSSVPAPQDPAVEAASVAEDNVPPITQNRSRTSADMADGAQERPGEGWEASAAEAGSTIVSPLAVDIAIAVDDTDPPETRNRGRISDEVDDSDGAHQRPGRGWDL
jgi:hypothetical protein